MRIGLFGGGFDPVHNAHCALAHTALRELALDELCWVPTGEPWHKLTRLAPAADRLAMVELALADPLQGDPRFSVEACELNRQGPSYTIDTVELLQAQRPGHAWTLVLGRDQHERLHTWHRWRELLAHVTLAVAGRPGYDATIDPEVAARGHLTLELPAMAVSSSALRRRVAEGLPITELVPAGVAGYIDSHRLYRHPEGPPDRDGAGRHQPPRS